MVKKLFSIPEGRKPIILGEDEYFVMGDNQISVKTADIL